MGRTVIAIPASAGTLVVLGLLVSLPVYWLWNWLMPTIFGLHQITWFQAWGLLILTGCLFKSSTSSSNSTSAS